MKKKDLLELIKNIKDEDDVDDALKESELAKKFGSLDVFKEKVKWDKEFKAYMDSEKDKHSSKALETWKTNNLQRLIDEEIKKRFPEKDPKDTELAKLKAEMEKMQKEAFKKDLTNKAIKIMTEKKLPVELVDFIVGADEDTTTKNLETLDKIFSLHDESIKRELLKDNSYTPPGGGEPTPSADFMSVITNNQAKRN